MRSKRRNPATQWREATPRSKPQYRSLVTSICRWHRLAHLTCRVSGARNHSQFCAMRLIGSAHVNDSLRRVMTHHEWLRLLLERDFAAPHRARIQ
jgi:hypothetical protein